MKLYKLNWRYWFFLVLFAGTVILGGRVIYMLLNQEVTLEDGTAMGFIASLVLSLALLLPLTSYLISTITMLRLLIGHDRCGLTLTPIGIEDTVVFVNILAFIFVLPVKCIPWEAITYYDNEEKTPYIRVNVRQVQAGFAAKMILKILGYHFCYPFVKPYVTNEDIAGYEHRFSISPFWKEGR